MKQIFLHILALSVAALTLVACGKEDFEPDYGNVAPSFTATIEVQQTRATDSVWESKDEIGISYTAGTSGVYNVCHVLTEIATGKFTVKNPEEQIYFNTGSRTATANFYAYYPYTYIANISSIKTIDVSTSDQTKQKSFDFLFASSKGSKESPEVDFQFTHKMSKVTFIFRDGNDFNVNDIDLCKLSGLYLNGKFNTQTGGVSSSSLTNNSEVSLDLSDFDVKDGKPVPSFMLLPQTVPGTGTTRPVNLEIVSKDGMSFVGTLYFPDNKLEPGENYIFTVKVSKTGVTVSNCTIDNWTPKEDTGWGTGNANSADDPEE